VFDETYFKSTPPYVLRTYTINNLANYVRADLILDIAAGALKVNGTARLFTIKFKVVLDYNYPAWWSPAHPTYKISLTFGKGYTYIVGQCDPFGPSSVTFWYYYSNLVLVDADPYYTPTIGDLNFDGHVNLDDLMLIRRDWHGHTYDIARNDNYVDIYDAVLVALNLWTGPLDR